MNKANGFHRRTKFPNCVGAADGTHIGIKMPSGSGSLFYNYKHFFSILLLTLEDADYCFIALVIVATESLATPIFKQFQHRKETGIESTGNPRQHTVV